MDFEAWWKRVIGDLGPVMDLTSIHEILAEAAWRAGFAAGHKDALDFAVSVVEGVDQKKQSPRHS